MRVRIHLALLLLTGALLPSARAEEPALSSEQIRALVEHVIANQHRDDWALQEYERIERRRIRKTEKTPDYPEDKTFRVVPTGTGIFRIEMEDHGRPVDAATYQKGLSQLEQALTSAADPGRAEQKRAMDKFSKRMRERAELIDAIPKAFNFAWLGREKRNDRTLLKLRLDPNPDYRPTSRMTDLLTHVRGVAWIDEATAQAVRAESEIFRDISFGGGLIGKVYRGGQFVTEQEEVAPGIWLPTVYDYNIAGRKFIFAAELHERTEASNYRRIGPPSEALAEIRREIARGPAAYSNR